MNNELAQLVSNARIKKGISQRELAKMIGVSNAIISRIENGLVKKPNYITLSKLSAILSIDLMDLFESVDYAYEDILTLQHINDFYNLDGISEETLKKYLNSNEIDIVKVKNDYRNNKINELEAISIFLRYLKLFRD